MKDCIISTSNVNSYGFRVLTGGIEIEQFQKNPLLLWMHKRPFEANDPLPIGRIENLRIEGDSLIGTPVFDENDEFALQIKNKWENNILNCVSAGLDVIETSEEPAMFLPKQKYATVTKAKLKEVSIVDIGANEDALGFEVNLSYNGKNDFKEFLKPIENDVKVVEKNEIELRLNEIENRLMAIENDNYTLLKKKEEQDANTINCIIEEKIKEGVITTSHKDILLKVGLAVGKEDFIKLIETFPKPIRPSELITPTNEQTKRKLSQVDRLELNEMYANNKALYNELYKNEYGIMPEN